MSADAGLLVKLLKLYSTGAFFLDCIDITSKCIRFVAYIINDISFKEGKFKEFISGELRFDVNKTRIYFRTNSLHTNTLFLSSFV